MVGRKRTVPSGSSKRGAGSGNNDQPDIYQQMLAEAGVSAPEQSSPERPLKRRRPGPQQPQRPLSDLPSRLTNTDAQLDTQESDEEDEDVEFQDVILPVPTVQTVELESDDEDEEEEDIQFEDVDFSAPLAETNTSAEKSNSLELNLTAHISAASPSKRPGERRKPISKEERERRVDIHKTHLLCLLSHVARRNHWCNDERVQESLRPHLTDKMVNYLNPGSHLPQFGQAESLKNGLRQAADVWKAKFEITERGLRRALWAEDAGQLQDYEPAEDLDSCLDRADFREAAKKLQGSRDVGAQLYCALLRSIGVRARLVCSLQPLPFAPGAPTLPKPKVAKSAAKTTQTERTKEALAKYEALAASAGTTTGSVGGSSARRRLGHPNATAYNFQPRPAAPKERRAFEAPIRIRESAHPVYWVEVLDAGHQKWQPADPVVTRTFWKTKAFEPPVTDKENCLAYVVAFEADGTAKDVTRRYAKAYTAKTRRLRVEIPIDDGGQWWRKALESFRRRHPTDLDQIEENELTGVEAREPMPRNVQDFKDHPVFALERHMRRHEVLVPEAKPSGTVGAGSRGPLEKIYRRKDVRTARSAEKWYRMGREVKPNEIPAKWLQKTARRKGFRVDDRDEVDMDDDAGTPIYTIEQTELYEAPAVRNGRVPKNKFGNIDAYVPSMIPKGAVHIIHEHAARAAFIVGVDYAPALTGFQFKGRQGTAVLNGIVVAKEFEAAIRSVIDGLADVEQEMEDERKRLAALKMWRRLLMGLRIRERIWSGVDEDERKEADREAEMEAELANAESDVTDEFNMVVDDDGEGGGFIIE
ncbi:DNA repair protein Rad4 [Metarhizium robertsii]|uniref:Homocitrate synthase n=2 Tax=Metarhizium robertsii TaxID=568076 RepID=A0A0B2XIK1_METRA|nr:homocitrate synthase [Metarhizium robertsii ARSEF 23]EXV05939.1 DNA repair protein Rad4 [Metarhizium robertsii]KHO11759.1 homocitrate synthase [Metarhizium robertsii ARSEF 23]